METLRSARTVAEWLNGKPLCQLLKRLKTNSLCNSNNKKDQQDNSKWCHQHYQKHVWKRLQLLFQHQSQCLIFSSDPRCGRQRDLLRCTPFDKSCLSETNFPPSFPFREISGTAGASGWFWMLWRVARVQPLPAAGEEQPWGPGTCREGAVKSSCTPAAPQRVIRWCCGGTDMSIRLAMSHIHSATQPGLWNATSGTANTDTFPSHLQEPRLWAMSPLLLQKNESQAQTKTNKWGKLWKH